MSKVTAKLQVTIPKALATEYGIRPGDEITWTAAGDVIRVQRGPSKERATNSPTRLELFDRASERQRARDKRRTPAQAKSRGWRREDLYNLGRPR